VNARRLLRFSGTVVFAVGLSLACSAAEEPKPPASSQQTSVIDPITPREDFVGPAPTRFSWTPIPRATTYAIGIWDDTDQMVWRKNDITTASVARPDDVRFPAGHTFFWSVVALREGQQIASSGMIAFVVSQ
jgi:hypothetical protein